MSRASSRTFEVLGVNAEDAAAQERILQQRLEIRTWSSAEVRERLADIRVFRDTWVPRPILDAEVTVGGHMGEPPRAARADVAHLEQGVPLYEALFLHRIDGPGLLELTVEDIRRTVGVKQLGVCKAILRNVRMLELQQVEKSFPEAFESPPSVAADDHGVPPYTRARPASASQRSVLDPFVDEQTKHTPDILARAAQRTGALRASGDRASPAADSPRRSARAAADDDSDHATTSVRRPASASVRIADLLDRSRAKRMAVAKQHGSADGQRPSSAGLAPARRVSSSSAMLDESERLTGAIRTASILSSAVAPGGVAAASPLMHEVVADYLGPASETPLQADATTPRSSKTSPPQAAMPSAAAGSVDDVTATPPGKAEDPSSAVVQWAAIEQEDGSVLDAVTDADGGAPDLPEQRLGPLEADRRLGVFADVYAEVREGMTDDKVRLSCLIETIADCWPHDWDVTATRLRMQQSYLNISRHRAHLRRLKHQQRLTGGREGVGGDTGDAGDAWEPALMKADDAAMMALLQPVSEETLKKYGNLVITRDEFVDTANTLTVTKARRGIDRLERLFSSKYGERQREIARREREAIGLFKKLDFTSSGLVQGEDVQRVLTATAADVQRIGAPALALPTSIDDSVGSVADDLTLPEAHVMVNNAWRDLPAEVYDEGMLALRREVEAITNEHSRIDRYLAPIDDLERLFRDRVSWELPVFVTHSTSVRPTVAVDSIAHRHGRTVRRFNVGSKKSENVAMEALMSHGLREGGWIAIEFPNESAAADPPPIPPALDGPLEEELPERQLAIAAARDRSRRGSAQSMASTVASSTGTSAAAAVDEYTGIKFTGAMLRCLRRIGLALATSMLRNRDFRLFVHLSTDFSEKDTDIPQVLRSYTVVAPLIRDPRPASALSPARPRPHDTDNDDVNDHDASVEVASGVVATVVADAMSSIIDDVNTPQKDETGKPDDVHHRSTDDRGGVDHHSNTAGVDSVTSPPDDEQHSSSPPPPAADGGDEHSPHRAWRPLSALHVPIPGRTPSRLQRALVSGRQAWGGGQDDSAAGMLLTPYTDDSDATTAPPGQSASPSASKDPFAGVSDGDDRSSVRSAEHNVHS